MYQNGPGVMPGGLSADSYLDRRLRALDAEHFSAAGLLPYRKGSDGSIELLFALERPWNSFNQSYDPLGWNIFGGKRIPRQERESVATAIRIFTDAVGQANGAPAQDVMYRLMANSFTVWYALGKFVLLMVEVSDEDLGADFPDKYAEWKKAQGSEEFSTTPQGYKKWTKQIDAVEWVNASDLLEPKKEVSDLLNNIMQINGFRDFLEGKLDPETAFAEADANPNKGRGGGKSSGKGGGKGKHGKGKGDSKGGKGWKESGWNESGWKGGMGKGGKGMPMYEQKGGYMAGPMPNFSAPMGGPSPMGAPMAMVYPSYDQNSMEMQRQMYGEQLYLMVQPMSPSPYLAQKITGMLLELPQNELMMNLTHQEELRKRVMEALDVLKEDGIA
jgi:hypothetical protein